MSFPVSPNAEGMENRMMVTMGISAVEMRSQGRLFCPFLNFTLSKMKPKMGSFTASQILTISSTIATLARFTPCMAR